MQDDICYCGNPLHYKDDFIKQYMHHIVKTKGRFIKITCNGQTYKVDRHYIALHGIKGHELPTLGFEKINKENQ